MSLFVLNHEANIAELNETEKYTEHFYVSLKLCNFDGGDAN